MLKVGRRRGWKQRILHGVYYKLHERNSLLGSSDRQLRRSEWSVRSTKVSLSEQVGTPALRALMWRGIGDSFRAILSK